MSVSQVRKRQRKDRYGLASGPSTVFVIRHDPGTGATMDRDTDVLYPQPVAGAAHEIDRDEWSRVIVELLEAEANGNRSELARLIGVDYQTIRRWIAGTHRVSEDSVRLVARAFHLSAIDLLIRVGYWKQAELLPAGAGIDVAVATSEGDIVLYQIKQAKLPPSAKRDLAQYVTDRRAKFEQDLLLDVERLIATELRARRA